MNYIEIKEGIRVKKSAIEFTEDLPDGGCRVATINAVWECGWPSEAIWDLIQAEEIEERIKSKESLYNNPTTSSNNLFGAQHWNG